MSSQLEDDTKYVKLLLLLLKGGTYVLKKHIQKILDSENTTIDICLQTHRDELFNAFKRRVINPKLWELLCSDSGKPKDVELWDISAHAYVLLNIFDARLNVGEKVAIRELRDMRNELVNRGDSSLQEKDFLSEWSRLTMVLYQLSTGLSSNDQDYVDKLIEDISAIKFADKATDDLKLFQIKDDIVQDVLAKQQCIFLRRLEELIQRICDVEKRSKEIDKSANTRLPGLDELTQHICALEVIKGNPKRGPLESDEWSHISGAFKEIKRIIESGQLESDEWSHIFRALKEIKRIVESGQLVNTRFPGFDELTQHICALEEIKGNPERGPLEISARITVSSSTQIACDAEFDELPQRICALEEIKRNPESGPLELVARFTVVSLTPTASDAAQRQLLEAAKRVLAGGHVNQEEDEVFTALNNMLTDMSKDGAIIKKVEEGSVFMTFSCSTLTSLKSALLYLTKTAHIQRLQELERAISKSVGCCVELNVNISFESFISTLGKKDKTLVLCYLSIEVGTVVLRKVFDHIVGPDLNVYLDKYPDRKPIFLEILPSTTAQHLLQPPNPSSDKLYITGLTKLLRNVCGLVPPNDQVWVNPEPTDNRVEANITRLAKYISIILKEGIEFESKTLTLKCLELCKALEGLSSYCGYNGLQEKISEGILRIIDQPPLTEETVKREKEHEKDELNLETGDLK